MGTPDFAVYPLQKLLEAGHKVVAVVTNPDKPAGRGQKIQESPVKKFAMEKRIPVLQPERFRDERFLEELRAFKRICSSWWHSRCCRRWFGICPRWERLICTHHCCRITGVQPRSTGR